VNPLTKGWLKSLLLPGGAMLVLAAALVQGGFLTISAPAIDFYYYAVFVIGVLLAWRFHSSRVMFSLLTLLLAHRALEFFSNGRITVSGPGRIALEAIALLLPLNFAAASFLRERGLAFPAIASRLGLLFLESVFVAVICRPDETAAPWFFHSGTQHLLTTRIPPLAILAFAVTFAILLVRFLLYRKPVESGLLWSIAATFLGLQAGGVGRLGSAYFATAGFVLAASLIENSYVLAYQDELTKLPGRRAFNEAIQAVEAPYAIAVVDIDHFKKFNDNYGHDAGDQVLRMVAARMAGVTGGGESYRVGGEEFSILFRGTAMKEAADHLELLRAVIEQSTFRVRSALERRSVPRDSDRRTPARKGRRSNVGHARQILPQVATEKISVTVSIGVAEPSAGTREIEQVIQAADKALYRAKQAGRNRVEMASAPHRRAARLKRSIAWSTTLRTSDQHAGDKNQRSAQRHLHGRRKCGRVHIAVTNPGDHAEFHQHHNHSHDQRQVEIGNHERQGMADPSQRRHGPTDHSSHPGVAAAGQTAIIGESLCKPHADSRTD
jgi:diguanylate cyclase (GGDEF)-like protein